MKSKAILRISTGVVMVTVMLAATVEAQPAAAQAGDPPTQQEIFRNYSLYWEDFRNGNYERAMPYLVWIIENAPAEPSNDDRNFERIVEGYGKLAEAAPDAATRRAYLDSALVMLDRAVPTLEAVGAEVDRFDWAVLRGHFIQSHAEDLPDLQDEVVVAYRKAYELGAERLHAYYVNFIIDDYVRQQDKEGAVDFMDEVEARLGDNEEIADFIAEVRNSLFQDPEERMVFLEGRLAQNPDDLELINELFRIYSDLGEREKMRRIGQRLVDMEPSPRIFQLLGRMYLDDGEPARAIALYERALAMSNGMERREIRDLHFNIGIAYQQQDRLQQARTAFRRALEADANFGAAWIAIGDLYATAISRCGHERHDRAVYWLVVDQYERARSVDSSVANQANSRINSYRRHFPTREDMHFQGWTPGERYAVNSGCYAWINETTTVRQSER
jgi:tetratricopeptide (TPR) repeat protein